MPHFLISDTHFGDRGPRDRFHALGQERLERFIDYVTAESGKLYVLGDMLDLWACNTGRVLVAHQDLLKRLAMVGARYVKGNHDGQLYDAMTALSDFARCEALGVLIGQERPFVLTANGRRFVLCHGHEGDSYCSSANPGIGEITAIIQGLLQEHRQSPQYADGSFVGDILLSGLERLSAVYRVIAHKPSRTAEFVAAMDKMRREEQAAAVVCGHTHAPGVTGDWLYNCGAWCTGRDTFVRIGDDGSAGVWEWKDGQAIPLV